MNYHLIFYAAQKTSLCEKSLKLSIKDTDLMLDKTCFATNAQDLGKKLIESLSYVNLVFIISNLQSDFSDNIEKVLSNALSYNPPELIGKISTDNELAGYIIKQKHQAIVLLPDNPDSISEIIENGVKNHLISNLFCNP